VDTEQLLAFAKALLSLQALLGVHPLGCPFLLSNTRNAPALLGCQDFQETTA
jgi:hypothetical protein